VVSKNIKTESFFAIVIIGPTASGKTSLAHSIADDLKKQNILSELVNLDAFQIYKNMTAGTAKPSSEEIKKYKYHCIDIISPEESLDANTFANKVTKACKEIYEKGSIPICVGGSGLYLRAFLHGLDDLPPRDEKIRSEIRTLAEEKGWPYCHDLLKEVDPVRASELHQNDKTRIERALEIYKILGKPMSSLRSKTNSLGEQETLFPCFLIQMEPNDVFLKERIKERVPILFQQGWLEEINQLYHVYGDALNRFNSMKAIGYDEILAYLLNIKKQDFSESTSISILSLQDRISTLTWQYAKRQLTWNAKEKKDFVVNLYTNEEYLKILNTLLLKIPSIR
jgi:tRNA dimethylallyltransferase